MNKKPKILYVAEFVGYEGWHYNVIDAKSYVACKAPPLAHDPRKARYTKYYSEEYVNNLLKEKEPTNE